MPGARGKGDVIWKIPKPFEVGVIFGSLPERMLHAAFDAFGNKNGWDRKKVVAETFRGFGESLSGLVLPRMTPTVATPFVQSWANKSLFTDRAIIPADRGGMLPEYQYSPYSTEFMKKISQIVGGMPGIGQMGHIQPGHGRTDGA